MMPTLKPCPFCGSEAKTWKQGLIRFQLVKCSDDSCGAFFTKFTPEEWNSRSRESDLENVLTEIQSEAYKAEKTVDIFKPNHQMGFIGMVIQQCGAYLKGDR